MLFDNGFNNRIDTKKACDYTQFVKYASDYLFASSRARRLARPYKMLLDLSSHSLKGILSDRILFLLPNFAGSKRRELFRHARMTLSISYILIPLPIFSINAISDNGFLSLGVNAFCFSLSGST